MLDDLTVRYVRARFSDRTRDEADAIFARVAAGETVEGLSRDDLLRLPMGASSAAAASSRSR